MLVLPSAVGAVGAAAACSSFGGSDTPTPSADAAIDSCESCGATDGSSGSDGGSAEAAADGSAAAVVAVRAGGQFACALHGNGSVSCWGRNDEGQVGQPPNGDLACDQSRCRPAPVAVPGLANVTQLAAGQSFACARTANGSVLCWGSNTLGTLAVSDPKVASRYAPGLVPGLPHAIDVSAGSYNACARVDEDGGVEVYCWGTNRLGLIGQPAAGTNAAPTRIASLSGAKSVVLSRLSEHGCAILADDSVVCWGENLYGSLGHPVNSAPDTACPNSKVCANVPAPVGGGSFKAAELAVGYYFACARMQGSGDVRCWGAEIFGSLGVDVSDGLDHPDPATAAVTGASAIVAGAGHACALVGSGVQCWGSNGLGELGNGNVHDNCLFGACKRSAQVVSGLPGAVFRISAGNSATFATTNDGREWAWGANPDGRLGHAPGTDNDLLTCGTQGRCNPTPQVFTFP